MQSSFEMITPKGVDINAGVPVFDSSGKQDGALAAQIESLVQAIANWLAQQPMAPTPPSEGATSSPEQPTDPAPLE